MRLIPKFMPIRAYLLTINHFNRTKQLKYHRCLDYCLNRLTVAYSNLEDPNKIKVPWDLQHCPVVAGECGKREEKRKKNIMNNIRLNLHLVQIRQSDAYI